MDGSHYVYEWWSADDESAWSVTAYEVTSADACLDVELWITEHAGEMAICAEVLSELESNRTPAHVLTKVCRDGTSRRHPLCVSHPAEPKKQGESRTRIVLISQWDLAILRGIFLQQGKACAQSARVWRAKRSGYVYRWPDTAEQPWNIYEVATPQGMRRVEEWIAANTKELRRGAVELVNKLSILRHPADVFAELFDNGVSRECYGSSE